MKHPITKTHKGIPIYVDLIKSPASTSISQQPHLVTLVKELLNATNLNKPTVVIEYDFGRNIGNCDVIETTEKDHIVYAKRVKQENFARFVRRRNPAPSTFITAVLKLDSDGEYELHDIWIGRSIPPMPGTELETKESKDYWANHALVFEGQSLQLRSLTTVCPY